MVISDPTFEVGTLSVFHSRYRDFIESKVNLGPDPATGTMLFQSRNVARAVIEGAEADAYFLIFHGGEGCVTVYVVGLQGEKFVRFNRVGR